jgi:hypothetical protein
MRFMVLERLMTGRKLKNRTTLELLDELVGTQRELYGVIQSSKGKWTWRVWESRTKRIARLQKKWEDCVTVVAGRFENLLLQMYRGLDTRYSKSCSTEEFVTFWSKPAMASAGDRARYACVKFWEAAEKAVNQAFNAPPAAIAGLKPKFMIRQFVEEIGDVTAREAVLTLAYEGRGTPPDDARELYRVIRAACGAFSDVLDDFPDMTERTDGSVNVRQLANRERAIDQVQFWLFEPWQ